MEARKPGDDAPQPDDYVGEIMEKVAEADVPPAPKKPRQTARNLLIVLVPIMVALTAWNVVLMTRDAEVFTTAEVEGGARLMIFLTVQEIEAYRDSTGGIPESLELLALDEEGLKYARDGDSYSLRVDLDSSVLMYQSGDDLTPFAEAWSLLGPAEGS